MSRKINADSIKGFLDTGLTGIKNLFFEVLSRSINDVETETYKDAIEVGISHTVSVLYEADVKDELFIFSINTGKFRRQKQKNGFALKKKPHHAVRWSIF